MEESEKEMQREIEKQKEKEVEKLEKGRLNLSDGEKELTKAENRKTVSYTLLKHSMKKQMNDFHRQLRTKTSTRLQ